MEHRESVKVSMSSLIGCSRGFGHKSVLDVAASSYKQFLFTTSSLSYDTSHWTTAAHIITGLNTLFNDLEKKGIIIKG